MLDAFIILIAAHLVNDFLFQNRRMVEAKAKSLGCLLMHSAVAMVLTLVFAAYFAGKWAFAVYLWVFLAHFAIDSIKKLIGKDDIYVFVFDQAAHFASLLLLAYLIPEIGAKSLWGRLDSVYYFKTLVFISGLVLCINVGGILISKATKSLVEQIKNTDSSGLENGGKYIGQLERALTFFFMLTGQTSAIGFLFAAKSILRFGEIKERQQRKEAEYIIIGTFMSFGWALVIAYLTNKALALW